MAPSRRMKEKLFVLSLSNGKRKYLPTNFNVYLDADYCYRYGHTHTHTQVTLS
jgi:hypothetical protein